MVGLLDSGNRFGDQVDDEDLHAVADPQAVKRLTCLQRRDVQARSGQP
jgi:hypothetical protein